MKHHKSKRLFDRTTAFLKVLTFIVLLGACFPNHLKAEGSKELSHNNYATGLYICNDFINNCSGFGGADRSHFAAYDCDSLDRLNFVVNNSSEVVYFGFQGECDFSAHIVYRIKDSNGNIVQPQQDLPTSGTGYINNLAEAIEGPEQLVGSAGYMAIEFNPPSTGVYYVEFNTVRNSSPTTTYIGQFSLTLFDVTVADAGTSIPGRLYSQAWQFAWEPMTENFYGKVYAYSTDSIITSLELNNMDGRVWVLYSNHNGVGNTGDFTQDRKSIMGDVFDPEYRIFLNEPDIAIFPPVTSFGAIVAPVIGQTHCDDGTIDFTVTVDKAAYVELLLNFDAPYVSRSILAPVDVGANIITWDGYDGSYPNPLLVANNTNINFVASYIMGLTNFPMSDVEENYNGFVMEHASSVGMPAPLFWDDSNLMGGPVNLSGCISSSVPWSGCHDWNYGDGNTINTWTYAATSTTGPVMIVQELHPDSLIFDQQPPQSYYPGATNISFSVAIDPSTDVYHWNYTGSDVTVNQVSPGDHFVTLDFGTAATAGNLEVYGTNSNCPNPGVTSSLPITIGTPPTLFTNFSAAPLSGDVPLTVDFSDLSVGNPTIWRWDFENDGVYDSYEQNPTHLYNQFGSYTVKLVIENGTEIDSLTKTNYITVMDYAIINYPYVQGFEEGGDFPVHWSQEYVTRSTLDWQFIGGNGGSNPATAHSGSYNACLKDVSTSDNKTKLISPALDLSAFTKAKVKFWHTQAISATNQDKLNVYYRYSSYGNWVLLESFDNNLTSWTNDSIIIDNLSSSYYIGFEGNAKGGFGVCIDDVEITGTTETISSDFSSDITTGEVPLSVNFSESSVGSIVNWEWDFGDGFTSTEQNPSHTYSMAGTFTVSLTVSDLFGSVTETKTDYITVTSMAPMAEFEGTPISGNAPLEVSFSDLSVGSPDAWLWDFGDGNSSTEQNPVHTYILSGSYTVSLTVSDPIGSSMETKPDYIVVSALAPVANFSASITAGDVPLEVTFADASTGEIDTWFWDFGDGETSGFQFPVHTYSQIGTFTVTLTVTGPGGSSMATQTDYITTVGVPPIAEFSAMPTSGQAPLLVQFTDLTTGDVNTWNWSFGDGQTSEEQNPSHEYLTPGNFTVSLTASGVGGSHTVTKEDFVLIPVGINEQSSEAIVVYPNPAHDMLMIVFQDDIDRRIDLYSTDGRLMKTHQGNQQTVELNLHGLPLGVYSLVVNSDNQVSHIVKVIKR